MGARLTSVSRQYHRETKTMRPDTEQYQYHGIYKYRDTVNAAIGHRICIQFDSERFELLGIIALAAGNDERVVIVLVKWSQVDLRSRPSIEGLGIPGEVCAVVPAG